MEDMDTEDLLPKVGQMSPMEVKQVPNSEGGYVWQVSDMGRLRRFLCLGSEGGSFYISERQLGLENAACISRLINEGKGEAVVQEVVDISVSGRAAKQSPALFALAMCARQDNKQVKKMAYNHLASVCRIPTHLFQFVEYAEKLSRGTGWGRAHREAVARWYNGHAKNPRRLALLVTKYRKRNGWSHRDVLRLAHVKPECDAIGAVLRYVAKGMEASKNYYLKDTADEATKSAFQLLGAFEAIQAAKDCQTVIDLVKEHKLVREHIPTEFLNEVEVWRMMLPHMPLTAMMRNLSKMTVIGLLAEGSSEEQHVVTQLSDVKLIQQARLHPFNILLALKTYQQGRGHRGKLSWTPNAAVIAVLEEAFYKSFKFVEPCGKRFCLALDVSGSMTASISNTNLSCRVGSAALAMVTARTEKDYEVMAFSHDFVPLKITAEMSLQGVVSAVSRLDFMGTDCSLPMQWATKNNKKFDVFVVYTDSETYFGDVHPAEALREYRRRSGIWDARLIVCGMCSNGFSIADPEDPGMLDMAGFDSAGPQVMRDFIMGIL